MPLATLLMRFYLVCSRSTLSQMPREKTRDLESENAKRRGVMQGFVKAPEFLFLKIPLQSLSHVPQEMKSIFCKSLFVQAAANKSLLDKIGDSGTYEKTREDYFIIQKSLQCMPKCNVIVVSSCTYIGWRDIKAS